MPSQFHTHAVSRLQINQWGWNLFLFTLKIMLVLKDKTESWGKTEFTQNWQHLHDLNITLHTEAGCDWITLYKDKVLPILGSKWMMYACI